MQECIIQFNWTDLLTALIDKFLDTACDDNVAIGVFLALVACTEESVRSERRCVGGGVVQVALCYVVASDADLCFLALRHFVAVGVEDSYFHALA